MFQHAEIMCFYLDHCVMYLKNECSLLTVSDGSDWLQKIIPSDFSVLYPFNYLVSIIDLEFDNVKCL